MDEKPRVLPPSMPASKSVLITGFEPFGGHTTNISATVAVILGSVRSILNPWTDETVDLEVTARVLPVDANGARDSAERWRSGERWDAILHMGLCESCELPRVERLARDQLHMRIPDNQGRQCTEETLDGGGARGCWVDPGAFVRGGRFSGAEVSDDAGAFVCNETYFHTLAALGDEGDGHPVPTPALFVHLPHQKVMPVEDALEFVKGILPNLVFPYPPDAVHVVAASITNGSGLPLVARRGPDQRDAGLWEFPGGKCEPGEPWDRALRREIKEELGLEVTPNRLLGTWLRPGGDAYCVIHLVGARLNQPSATPTLSVHDAWMWVDLPTADSLAWAGRDGEMHRLLASLV
jgi:pyrrolidone-carboxylate peptidase/8-oxo-dGTP pyrophosphatase MutT (NUDIX family)